MLHIEDIVSNKSWQDLQDSLAHVTKMAIITVNYDGKPVTAHSNCHEFCRKVRDIPHLGKYCEKCDARGGFEAMRTNRPYIYKCYFDIVDIAIPIVINHKYIGALMAGQIRLSDGEDIQLEKILLPSHMDLLNEEKQKWMDEYNRLPFLSYGRLRVITNMLFYLCNYVCSEKNATLLRYQQIMNLSTRIAEPLPEDIPGDEVVIESSEEEKRRRQAIHTYTNGQYHTYKDTIRQALDFIFSGEHFYPALQDVADHCHVSTSYFSRLFSREVGEGYASFLTRLKTDHARELLRTSNLTINEISDRLGYEDTGYFIKVFKKQTGVTPSNYRKLIRS